MRRGFIDDEGEAAMAGVLTKAGRYQIVSELGRGSMGVVYRGFDPVIGRTVAIKTMLPEGLSAAEFEEYKARFQREAQAAGVLNHPNIVTVYDFGEDNNVLYLAMEFLEGKSLQNLVEEKNVLPVETIIPMYEQVCSALDYAHAHNIVHRDIKPANIMILESGRVKVMDFGIAKMMSTGMTQAGQILGTPNYMSPEQVRGRAVDGRSDIFSLGVILYELVTGEKPFFGQNITTVIYKIINEDPIPPRELDATIHPGLSYVISRALTKNPDERYQTCRELAEGLNNYKNLAGVPAPGTTIIARIPRLQAPPVAPPVPPAQLQVPPERKLVRPLSVQVIPPARPQPRRASPAVWLLVILFLAAGLGGSYYFYRYQQGQQVGETPASATTPTAGPQEATTPPPMEAAAASSGGPSQEISRPDIPSTEAPTSAQDTFTEAKREGVQPEQPESATVVAPPLHGAQPTPAERASAGPPTPAKPPAAPKYGRLVVDSGVPGATITLDGKSDPDWVTPYTFSDLPAGPHTVIVSKEGYRAARRSPVIEAGQTSTVTAELTVLSGDINIVTNPPGAEVVIDEKSYGPSPVWATLPVGKHTYRILRPGMNPYESSFEIKFDGYTLRRTVELGGVTVTTGIVEVHTTPPGATIYADGKPVGTPAPTSFRLPPGEHTLSIYLSGFRPLQKKIEVPADGSLIVNETLSPQ